MKNIIIIISIMIMVSGCGILKSSTNKNNINDKKVKLVSELAYITDYYLVKTNVPQAIISNDKVISIVGTPSYKDIKVIEDNITGTNFNNIDKKIIKLQSEEKKVEDNLNKEALKVPILEQELSEYKSYFGFGGLFKSIKRIGIWILVCGIVFFILRILSSVNPITGAIFSIIETIISYIIKVVHILVPKAVEQVTTSNSALNKIVKSIETNTNIDDLKVELKDKMNNSEKIIIKEIKNN